MAYSNSESSHVRSGSGDILSKTARTALTGNSGWVDIGDAKDLIAQLQSDAGTGTAPTLDVKFQTSYNGSDASAIDLPNGAFTQVGTVAANQIKSIPTMHRFIKAVWTLGGTTPGFNFGVFITTRR